MLGRAVVSALADHAPFTTADRTAVDLADRASIDRIPATTRVVVNCAAYTNVNEAERNEVEAHAANAVSVGWLAERCHMIDATLVHYSTDYVFDGAACAPYAVDHPRAPINAYGRSKAAGEARLEASGASYLLIRTSWLHAPWGANFVRRIAKLAAERDELQVVNDQRGRPTSVESLARTTFALLDAGARGTFHATDGGDATWFDLAKAVAAYVRPVCHVAPCSSVEQSTRRPTYSVLDLSRTEALVGSMQPWQDALRTTLEAL